MICRAPRPKSAPPAWHAQFLAMLPVIRTQARFAFRHLDPEAREDAVEEAIANALVAFVRLVELHRRTRAPSPGLSSLKSRMAAGWAAA